MLVALAVAPGARAQTGVPTSAIAAPTADVAPEDIAAVARQLNCPLCQGYTLQDCPLAVCAQMRQLIGTQLAAGQSQDAIIAGFVTQYGPQVLNAPPRRGFHLLAWLLPGVALAVGASLAVILVRRRPERPPPAPAAPASVIDAYGDRLEALLEEREA